MKRFLSLAVLFGLFAGFVGCGETTSTPPPEKPAATAPADVPPAVTD